MKDIKIKSNLEIEEEIILKQLRDYNINDFDKTRMRSLLWNTILLNLPIYAKNYIHIYIDEYEKCPSQIKSYINSLISKDDRKKIKKSDRIFKIRFMIDGFNTSFKFINDSEDSEIEIQEYHKRSLKIYLESLSKNLNYNFELLNIKLVYKKSLENINKIDLIIAERDIPIKVI